MKVELPSDYWEKFKATLPSAFSEITLMTLRYAFFAGCAAVNASMQALTDIDDEDEGGAAMGEVISDLTKNFEAAKSWLGEQHKERVD
jgi:hypothetical protein